MNEKNSKNTNKSKDRKNISRILYITGSAALIFMLAFSAVNFIRDARVLRLPVLSKAAAVNKDTKSGETGDYNTLKYKKPAVTASPKAKNTPAPQKTADPKSATPTPEPTRAAEP